MQYTKEQMESIEKVKTVFADYLTNTPHFDVVWSEKVGYVLLRGINSDQTDFVFQPLILEDGAPLCSHCLVEMGYDIIEREKFGCDLTETTFAQQKFIREIYQPYMEQLPEYAYLIDSLFIPNHD